MNRSLLKNINRSLPSSLFLILCLQVTGQIRHSDFIGSGHDRGITVTAGSSNNSSPESTIDGFLISNTEQLKDASRFLAQTTFGADLATIQMAAAMGYEDWLDEQFNLPYSPMADEMSYQAGRPLLTKEIFHKWFRSTWISINMTAPDLLRQRLAFAWSQIMVINDNSDFYEDVSQMVGYYYDQLAVNSFDNFQQLLTDVTLSVAMGNFLSHYNNHKEIPEKNIHPDENYAREIMQLFSIGLWELNQDGTLKLDNEGQPIPTYTNADIKEFAQVFTGLGDGNDWGIFGVKASEADSQTYIVAHPMRVYEEYHDPSEKNLLNGVVLPAGQPGMDDIAQTITHLVNHNNTAPFICKSLIKLLTTSNPSPKYVGDVAAAFDPEEPGNFKKVIKTIFLHPEAREMATGQYTFGKLREPVVRLMNLLRAFPISPNLRGDYLMDMFSFGSMTGQSPVESPSVFNFFLPYYTPPGPIEDNNLIAPEFHIMNSTNAIGGINDINVRIFDERYFNDYYLEGGFPKHEWDIFNQYVDENSFKIDFETELSLVDTPSALVDRLDLVIANGLLDQDTKKIIEDAIAQIDDPMESIKMALYLTLISPDYAILK